MATKKSPTMVDGTPFTIKKFFSRRFLLVVALVVLATLSTAFPGLYHALVGNWQAIAPILAFILGDSAYKIVVALKNTLDE